MMVNSNQLVLNPNYNPLDPNSQEYLENPDIEPLLFKVTTTSSVTFACEPGTVALGFHFIYSLEAGIYGTFDLLSLAELDPAGPHYGTYRNDIIICTIEMNGYSIANINTIMADKTEQLFRDLKQIYVGVGSNLEPTTWYESASKPLRRAISPIYPSTKINWMDIGKWKPTLFGYYDLNTPYRHEDTPGNYKTFSIVVYSKPSRFSSDDAGLTRITQAGVIMDFANLSYTAGRLEIRQGEFISCSYYLVGHRKIYESAESQFADELEIYAGPSDYDGIRGMVNLDYYPVAIIAWTGSSLSSMVFPVLETNLPSDISDMSFYKVDIDSVVEEPFVGNVQQGAVGDIPAEMSVGTRDSANKSVIRLSKEHLVYIQSKMYATQYSQISIKPVNTGSGVEYQALYGRYMSISSDYDVQYIEDELVTYADIHEEALGRYLGTFDTVSALLNSHATAKNGQWAMIKAIETGVLMQPSARSGLAIWCANYLSPKTGEIFIGWVYFVDYHVIDFKPIVFDDYTIHDIPEHLHEGRVFALAGADYQLSDHYDQFGFTQLTNTTITSNSEQVPALEYTSQAFLYYMTNMTHCFFFHYPELRHSGEYVMIQSNLAQPNELQRRDLVLTDGGDVLVSANSDLVRACYVGDANNDVASVTDFYRFNYDINHQRDRSVTGAYIDIPDLTSVDTMAFCTLTGPEYDHFEPLQDFYFANIYITQPADPGTPPYPTNYQLTRAFARDKVDLRVTTYPLNATSRWVKAYGPYASDPAGGAVVVTADGGLLCLRYGRVDNIPIQLSGDVDGTLVKYINVDIKEHVVFIAIDESEDAALAGEGIEIFNLVNVGDQVRLHSTAYPIGRCNPAVTWATSDTTILTIESDTADPDHATALITLHAPGTCQITATSQEDTQIVGHCTIGVRAIVNQIVLITTELNIDIGDRAQIQYTVNPASAFIWDVSYTVNPEGVGFCSVDRAGVVTALSVGTAIITLVSLDATPQPVTAQVIVHANIGVRSIELKPETLQTIPINHAAAQMEAITYPANATNRRISWSIEPASPVLATITVTEDRIDHYSKAEITTGSVVGSFEIVAKSVSNPNVSMRRYIRLTRGDVKSNLFGLFGIDVTRSDYMEQFFLKVEQQIDSSLGFFHIGDYFYFKELVLVGTTVQNLQLSNGTTLLQCEVVDVNSYYDFLGNVYPQVTFQFTNIVTNYTFNTYNTNSVGYSGSGLRQYMNGSFMAALEHEGVDRMKLFNISRRVSNAGGAEATQASQILDRLWIPTEYEVMGENKFSNTTWENATNQVKFTAYNAIQSMRTPRVKYAWDGQPGMSGVYTAIPAPWWLASPSSLDPNNYCYVQGLTNDPSTDISSASLQMGVSPCFCITGSR
jgi:hypothetical protein